MTAALAAAGLAAAVVNPRQVREFARATGQLAKVALVACMRKLLTIANVLPRDGVPWSPDRAVAA